MCYAPISVLLLRVFRCVDIDGTLYLLADTRHACGTDEWALYAVWSACLITVYTAGMPILILVLLTRNRHRLTEKKVTERLGFLYEVVGAHAYASELVEATRRLLLVSVSIFFNSGSPLQLVYAVLVSAFAWVYHATYKPFTHNNRLAYYAQVSVPAVGAQPFLAAHHCAAHVNWTTSTRRWAWRSTCSAAACCSRLETWTRMPRRSKSSLPRSSSASAVSRCWPLWYVGIASHEHTSMPARPPLASLCDLTRGLCPSSSRCKSSAR